MKRIVYSVLSLSCLSLFFYGCKKETTVIQEYNPEIRIYGTWKVSLAPKGSPDLKYIAFNTNKLFYGYSKSETGFNNAHKTVFAPFTDQVLLSFFPSTPIRVCNYKFNGDTLVIESDDLLVKALRASETETANWIQEIEIIDKIDGLYENRSYGLGTAGGNLLLPDYNGSQVSKINLTTGLFDGDISVTGSSPLTVAFDGSDLWVSNNGTSKINRHALTGGSVLSSSPTLGAWINGIAYDPGAGQLWAYSSNVDTLYQFIKSGSTVLTKRNLGKEFTDLCWQNGKLYVCSGNCIYRVNTNGFTIEKAYKLKQDVKIFGITAVGTDFWVNVEGNQLLKIALN